MIVHICLLLAIAAAHSAEACSGNFTALTGVIQSPNYPGTHGNNANCTYVIMAPEGYRITLNFTALDLESCCDYVKIRDGGNASAPLIGTATGSRLPYVRRSSGNQLWLRFTSDGSVTNTGFRATYKSEDKRNESFMLVATSSSSSSSYGYLYRVDTDTGSYHQISFPATLYKALAVDYDPVGDRMYWTEASSYTIRLRSSPLIGGSIETILNLRSKQTSYSRSSVPAFEGIAVDPLSRLIFYTDAMGKRVVMMTISRPHQQKSVILTEVSKPRAIVLDTVHGVMFWTDWGTPAKIERANYDGSDRRTVVSTNLTYPNGLAIDVANNKLYWVDGSRDRVESSDLEGNDRTVLYEASYSSSYRQYFGLALFNDSLYITNKVTSSSSYYSSYLLELPLDSNTTRVTTVFSMRNRLNDVHVYNGITADLSPNGCGNDNGECDVICIPLPNNSSKCACPDKQELSSDGRTCVNLTTTTCGGNFTALNGTITSPNFPGEHDNDLNCTYLITAPEGYRITLTFTHLDLESSSAYYYRYGCMDYVEVRDGGNGTAPLLGRYCDEGVPLVQKSFGNQLFIRLFTDSSITSTGFNATYRAEEGDGSFFLITRGGGSYSSSNSVYRVDPDTLRYSRIPISQNLYSYKPLAVDYDPVGRKMYWTDVRSSMTRIGSADLNGSNAEIIFNVTSKRTGYSSSTVGMDGIAVDPLSRLIFFTDAWTKRVAMMTMSGFEQKTVATTNVDKPRAIVLDTANGVVYWTDWGTRNKIERANYDGSGRRILVNTTLTYPNGLAIDLQNKKLYWVDGGTNRVESSDLDGNNRTVLYRRSSSSYYSSSRQYTGLTLFHNALYITAKRYSSYGYVMKMPLGTSRPNMTQVLSLSGNLNDIHAYHKKMYSAPNGCGSNNGGCKSICLPLPSNQSKCACPNGQQLTSDGKSCGPMVCGGTYRDLTGTITSPNFPGVHGNNLNCTYLITAPEGYRITLNFTHMDLESRGYYSYSENCNYDYIEIREGNGVTAPLIGRYCNEEVPFVRRSFGNQLFIRLVTDYSVTNTGFSATYTSEETDDYFLLVTSGNSLRSSYRDNDAIYRVDPDSGVYYNITMSQPLYNPLAVSYDPVEQKIYWTEKGKVVNRIRTAYLNGSNVENIHFADTVTSQAILDGIAVDPLSRLIFYTDAGHHEIVMLTMTSPPQRRTVATLGVDKPRAIVLDTANGVVYWTDWGTESKIERTNYDGTERRTVVRMGLNYTNGLAIDVPHKKLYWVDAGTDLVESSDLDGNNRTVLYNASRTQEFFGLALLQNSLYITDWGYSRYSYYYRGSALLKLPLTGENSHNATQILSTREKLNDVHAYQESIMNSGANGCGNNKGGCSDFCIPLPSNRSKCACPDGESLNADGKNCGKGSVTTTTAMTTTTSTTTTTTTPIPSNVKAYIQPSEPMPFPTDGSRELRLTCILQPPEPVIGYEWNVQCLNPGAHVCVLTPCAADQGTVVTCTATMSNGRIVPSPPFNLSLAHPPLAPPKIAGYSGEIKQTGDNLTLTCTVSGGYPLVSSVNLTCQGHTGKVKQLKTLQSVSSTLFIDSLRAEDNGTTCVCTADWKDPDLYRLNHTVTLLVNGTSPDTGKSTGTKGSSAGSIVGAVIGVVVAVVIVVVVVVFVIRRKRRQQYDDNTDLVSQSGDSVVSFPASAISGVTVTESRGT